MEYFATIIDSPIGALEIIANKIAIVEVHFENEFRNVASHCRKANEVLEQTVAEIGEYFEGKRNSFDVVLLPPLKGFYCNVLTALQGIKYGDTRTYGYIAELLNSPKASRAVGSACNKNPLPILIPCHRVIGKNGNLTGYRGEVWRKEFLLQLEKSNKQLI
ncbi:MAG: methylated-DNA--[protein]-cysteine S-methyltransferase [Ignavibacteria bacterium]|jgi:O-6-methylguanine DNA methyltransferase|nr:methylated-DNA--[protein]-cysteine S-methyltransferase [Ignavibacteria bacterium]